MAIGPQQTVLYPLGSRILAGAIVVICGVIEAALISFGHADITLRATPAVLLVALGAFVLFWNPRVELDPAELLIVNPVRSYRISWPAIREIDSRWSLTLDTARGRVTAWAAPAPGPFSQLSRVRRDAYNRVSLGSAGSTRGAELARSLIVGQWEAYREQGVLGAIEGEGVTIRWNVPIVAILIVLAAGTLAGALVP